VNTEWYSRRIGHFLCHDPGTDVVLVKFLWSKFVAHIERLKGLMTTSRRQKNDVCSLSR
jgi:hypothetical protein